MRSGPYVSEREANFWINVRNPRYLQMAGREELLDCDRHGDPVARCIVAKLRPRPRQHRSAAAGTATGCETMAYLGGPVFVAFVSTSAHYSLRGVPSCERWKSVVRALAVSAPGARFIRLVVNAKGIVASVCALCRVTIGYSSFESALSIAERAHNCHAKKPPQSVWHAS
jgi:hypothetical protein